MRYCSNQTRARKCGLEACKRELGLAPDKPSCGWRNACLRHADQLGYPAQYGIACSLRGSQSREADGLQLDIELCCSLADCSYHQTLHITRSLLCRTRGNVSYRAADGLLETKV